MRIIHDLAKKSIKEYKFTAEITWDKELKLYTAIVPELPGAHTQAASLDELNQNLREVIQLCLEEIDPGELENMPELIGIQQINIAV
jgi:predicted RNase H-like HicB family nuclease